MTAVEVVADADGTLLVRKRASTPAERRRLHREAVALARAAHPGVVPLVEPAGRSGGAHTDAAVAPVDERSELLTRFVGGHTLETTGPASTARARIERLTILAAVADILGDLHAQGLVHGALDPSHIVLDQGNRPVLCGFSRSGEVGTLPWPLPPPDLEPSNEPLRPSGANTGSRRESDTTVVTVPRPGACTSVVVTRPELSSAVTRPE